MANKNAITVEIMTANPEMAAEQVIQLIADAISAAEDREYPLARAKSKYNYALRNGNAPGIGFAKADRAAKPKAEKAPKAAKKVSIPATKKARIAEAVSVEPKSEADIEAIRAANLEKIRQVHQKMIGQGILPNTLNVDIEVEEKADESDEEEINRDFPQYLDKAAVTEMVDFGFDRELEE